MSVRLAFLVVEANLCGRNDKALRLDGPGPQQHLPVRLARRHGKGGRIGESGGALFAQNRTQLGETDIVALKKH